MTCAHHHILQFNLGNESRGRWQRGNLLYQPTGRERPAPNRGATVVGARAKSDPQVEGATREEIVEALGVSVAINAGAALVYWARTLNAYAVRTAAGEVETTDARNPDMRTQSSS